MGADRPTQFVKKKDERNPMQMTIIDEICIGQLRAFGPWIMMMMMMMKLRDNPNFSHCNIFFLNRPGWVGFLASIWVRLVLMSSVEIELMKICYSLSGTSSSFGSLPC